VRAFLLALSLAPIHLACSHPPNPIVNGKRVTILVESTSAVVPAITGDFTEWKPRPAAPMGRRGWYQFETTLDADARVEYLIFFGAQDLRVDPRNPHRVPSVGGEASEITMPGAEAQPETIRTNRPPAGVFEERSFTSIQGTRRVVVYRPAQLNAAMPIAYFHDGSLMLEKGGVPQILDHLVSAARLRPLVAVFVDPVSRADDYKADPAFRDWFTRELVPQIEGALSFRPLQRAVIGVSRGAAAALDLAWHHPEIFSRCGLLIPSTSPTDVVAQIARSPAKPILFSTIAARYDAQWLGEGRALREALDAKGYQQTYREVPEGHNVQTWRGHLDDVLIGLGFGTN
jgi:enterochelin esterase-like enzyme